MAKYLRLLKDDNPSSSVEFPEYSPKKGSQFQFENMNKYYQTRNIYKLTIGCFDFIAFMGSYLTVVHMKL